MIRPLCWLHSRYVVWISVLLSVFHKTLLQLKKEGKAILLISAELSEVMNLSDRIAVLYEGEMSAQFKAGQYTKEEIGLFMAGKKQEDMANEMDQQ